MIPRPSFASLGRRRAPALHRTLPTWAREPVEDGVEYRLYVPSINGIAVFTCDTFPTSTSRAEVARRLRERRRMLWGRDRLEAVPSTPTAPEPLPAPPPPVAPALPPAQGSLF